MKFNLFNLSLVILIPQVLASPEDGTTEFEEKDLIPSETLTPSSSTSTVKATTTVSEKNSTTKNYRDNITCSNYNMDPFSSSCKQRAGTVTYTTFGFNCIESARCIYDGTTVSFNNNKYTFSSISTNYRDHLTCSFYNLSPFSSYCKDKTGTVTYSTYGVNCKESVRCVYESTTEYFDPKIHLRYTPTPTPTPSIDSTSTDDVKISNNGQCGSKDGRCPTGQCCSKYGWCGTSEQHCSAEKGCQSEFGQCKNDQTDPISTTSTTTTITTTTTTTTSTTINSRDYIVCTYFNLQPFSSYCKDKTGTVTYSTYGVNCKESVRCIYESTTESFDPKIHLRYTPTPTPTPSIDSTPTYDVKISINGQCGSTDGQCPSGQCCSKYGWCGTSEQHCLVENGCQSEFGQCNTIKIKDLPESTNGRCGSNDGICPSGQCCSKYGWCGTSSSHCDSGCKKEYGICN